MNYSDWEQRQMDEASGAELDRHAERMARRQQRSRYMPGGEQFDADLIRDMVEPFEPDEAA